MARLEEIALGKIESAGKTEVIQYRGRIMSVLRLSDVLGIEGETYAPSASGEDRLLPLVVCALESSNVGVIVDSIEDIVEDHFEIQTREGQLGILGSAIVQQKVTDLLDVRALARTSVLAEA